MRVGVLAVACDGDGLGVVGAGEDGGHGEVDGLGDASFPCDGEVGDLAVGAHVMCGYDAALLGVHCVACADRVACEDGVGSVVRPSAASAGVACSRPEDVGVDVPRVVDGVGGRAAVCLVPLVFEVGEVGVRQVEEVVHEVAERVSAEAEGRVDRCDVYICADRWSSDGAYLLV